MSSRTDEQLAGAALGIGIVVVIAMAIVTALATLFLVGAAKELARVYQEQGRGKHAAILWGSLAGIVAISLGCVVLATRVPAAAPMAVAVGGWSLLVYSLVVLWCDREEVPQSGKRDEVSTYLSFPAPNASAAPSSAPSPQPARREAHMLS